MTQILAEIGEPDMDCSICGESLCSHGLCRDTGSPWKDPCPGALDKQGYCCDNCAEAQQQREIEAYYGGDSPSSYGPSDPVALEAWRIKQ